MVNQLRHRLKIMETQAQRLLTDFHFISVLIYPHHMAEDAMEGWLAEQLRCHCRPDCLRKRAGVLLPEKCSPEVWTDMAQRYYQRKANSDE